jgi:predicted MFS family arabinose efflux permease
VAGSCVTAGVLLGGMLTQWAGWEWVLFVNVPIGIAAALIAPRLLPESRVEGARHFDVAGAVTVTAGLSLLVYSLVDAHSAGWGSAQTIILLAVAAGLIAAFVLIERVTRAPLVPIPGIFRLRSIRGINITGLLIAMSLFSMFFFISLYMQQVLGYSPLKAGVSYLPLAGGIIVSAGIASQLVTRFGVKPVLVSGLVLIAGGLVWFAQISVGGSYVSDILGPSLLSAFGLGFAFVPMTVAAVAGVEAHESGLASGLINTSQQVGGALGLAILAAISDSKRDSVLSAAHALPVALVDGFRVALTVGAGFAIVGAVLALLLVSGDAKALEPEGGEAEAVPVAA